MSEAPGGESVDEEQPNIVYSPSGSATTGFSGGSSLGLQYKGAWCTPPRVFVDYQVLVTTREVKVLKTSKSLLVGREDDLSFLCFRFETFAPFFYNDI